MKNPRQAYIENIERIDKELNKGYNPNRDKLGRFSFGSGGKSKKSSQLSESEIIKFAQNLENNKVDSKKGDEMLQQIYERQGFNKKPTAITKKQYYEEFNGTKVYRGIEKTDNNDYAKEFISGKYHFAGKGLYGNGSYMTNNKNDAFDYAGDKGFILDIIIPSNAKLINQTSAAREANYFAEELLERGEKMKNLANKNKDKKLLKNAESLIVASEKFRDPGAWAASQGYDGIIIKNTYTLQNQDTDHYIIFNRGILKVNKEITTI
jgi:hypothetical protein